MGLSEKALRVSEDAVGIVGILAVLLCVGGKGGGGVPVKTVY